MTLRVWRTSRGHYLADCDACGSRGRPATVQVTSVADLKSETARQESLVAAHRLRTRHAAEIGALIRARQNGRMKRSETDVKIKKLSAEYGVTLREILGSTPGPRDGVAETATACPWCGAKENVVVQELPEGVVEPLEFVVKRSARS